MDLKLRQRRPQSAAPWGYGSSTGACTAHRATLAGLWQSAAVTTDRAATSTTDILYRIQRSISLQHGTQAAAPSKVLAAPCSQNGYDTYPMKSASHLSNHSLALSDRSCSSLSCSAVAPPGPPLAAESVSSPTTPPPPPTDVVDGSSKCRAQFRCARPRRVGR